MLAKKSRLSKIGAIEMSIGTIVIIVIAVTMLIFGIIFVRNIMCSAISLTSDVGEGAKSEINKLFSANGGEIQCLGNGEAVALSAGSVNKISCGIRAPIKADYEILITDITGTVDKEEVEDWVITKDFSRKSIAAGDTEPKPILRLNVPEQANEQTIIVSIEAKKDGETIYSQELDFEVKRVGYIKSAMC